MSRTSIGRIIHDLWGGKSVRFKRVGKRGEKPTQGYINMRKSVGSTSTTGSINADGKKYSIDSIQAEVVLENWRAIKRRVEIKTLTTRHVLILHVTITRDA